MVVTVDLGDVYTTTGATLWRYYFQTSTRKYCNQKLALSATGQFAGEETVVYEIPACSGFCTDPSACTNAEAGDCTAANYGAVESASGTVLQWPPTAARFVRQWSGRNNENTGSHLSEIAIRGHDPSILPDASGIVNVPEQYRSYSSVWGNDAPGTGHAQSTLDSPMAWLPGVQTFAAGTQWMQMDLGRSRYVSGLVTKGRDGHNQWTTSYKVQYSLDGVSFQEHADAFAGNTDRATKISNYLPEPVLARYVRVLPYSHYDHAAVRAAVMVSDVADCASCVRPGTAGYDFSSASETLALHMFDVSGVTCSTGYTGTPTATVCSADGAAYSVSG
jgi:hypothetical protein